MTDVLLGLADDVSREIVVEWLEFADVANLDSAYNNRELSRVFRGLLSSPLILFDFSQTKAVRKRAKYGSLLKSVQRRTKNLPHNSPSSLFNHCSP